MATDAGLHQDLENQAAKVLFGPFQLDLVSGELRRNGTRFRLQKQPLQILMMLLERPGDAIAGEELCRRIWPNDVHVDFDGSLAVAVRRLRNVLCDSASKPRYIETVGRGSAVPGYRFIAPVEGTVQRQSAPLKLAVLPFSSLGFRADDYFLDGLVEELTARLGTLIPSRLAVIARSSVIASVQSGKTPQETGQQLKADYLLEGTVRSDRNKCRVTVQLVRVSDQTTAWSQSFESSLLKLGDRLSLETRVAKQIVKGLGARLFPGDRVHHGAAKAPNLKAYEEYLRGRYHWWNANPRDGWHLTKLHYEKAIEIDPSFALAYSGLADMFNIHTMYGLGPKTEVPSYRVAAEKARHFANKTLDLDPNLAEAHAAQGFCLMQHEWDWPAAEKEYRRALELDPNCVVAHHHYGWGLVQTGRFEEAFANMEAARNLDPLSLPVNGHLSWFLYLAGRFDKAIAQAKATVDIYKHPLSLHTLALAYCRLGHLEDASCAAEECLTAAPGHGVAYSLRVRIYAAAGLYDKARDALRSLESMGGTMLVSPYSLALAYAGIGDRDRCFDALQTAVEERSGWIPHLNVEPAFDELRIDPRWAQLLKEAAINYGPAPIDQAA